MEHRCRLAAVHTVVLCVLLKMAYPVPVLQATTSKRSSLADVHRSTVENTRPSHDRQNVGNYPEASMTPTELITSKGYPCENHYVTTQDGFILNMQRIPYGRKSARTHGKDTRPAVLLQHGLLGTSYNWLDNLANESLAYLLADAGADVWLANGRGNTFSRNHTTLKPTQPEFWAWSWDEMGAYDLPAMFDHVTRVTGQQQIHYVGHSQGTMIGFAGFSTNVTLAAMVKRFYALAPVARVGHIRDPWVRRLASMTRRTVLEKMLHRLLGSCGVLTPDWSLGRRLGLTSDHELYRRVLHVFGGFRIASANMTRMPVYLAHGPGGTSVRNVFHLAQGINSNKFLKFDFESESENSAAYNQTTPPEYLLSNMRVPVLLYRGTDDRLADPADVTWLRAQLPNIVEDKVIPGFEHLDFIWGMDAPKYCYFDLIAHVFEKSRNDSGL
ncbi:hypothetical protein BaRGS_00006396 [Batillaria attramentaria]|uniref:Partial AB-hydrolase lipase domain-containing protein n=1 Tax=Batillaria attramentaria TaxID=370345 RepID=A0ABD0LTJ0_9CAEN